MIRLFFASAFAFLGLFEEGEAQPAQVEVLINFQPAPPRTPGYEIWVEGVRMHASPVNDAATISLQECTANTRIQVRPADNRYSWPTLFCANPLTAQVRFIRAAASFWDQDNGSEIVAYTANITSVLDNVAAAAAGGNEEALALREALDAENPAMIAKLAREMGELVEEEDLVLGYHLIALYATFQAAGIDPADGLLRFAEDLGTPVLTQKGDAILADVSPDWLPPLPIEGPSVRTPEIVLGNGSYGRIVSIEDLKGLTIFDSEGIEIGQFGGLTESDDGKAIIVNIGEFLGLGERDVAVSRDAISLKEMDLMLSDFTVGELEELPENNESLLSISTQVEFRFDG